MIGGHMSLLSRLSDLPDGHSELWHDFSKRFNETYMVLTTDTGKKHPVFFYGKDGNYLIFRARHQSDNIYVDVNQDANIQPFIPPVGYYNINTQAHYLIKVPQRQWKRSFCNSIYKLKLDDNNQRLGWDVVKAILNPEYLDLNAVTTPFLSNIALSKYFALKYIDEKTNLYYRQYQVGHLDFDNMTIHFKQPVLLQEIRDFFKYTGVTKWNLVGI